MPKFQKSNKKFQRCETLGVEEVFGYLMEVLETETEIQLQVCFVVIVLDLLDEKFRSRQRR